MLRLSFILFVALVVLCVNAAEEATTSPNLKYYYPVPPANPPQTIECDLCVYGGTPGGVTAAIQMNRMGKKAVLVSFNKFVGGLTSGGLSATDVGNGKSIGGMAREFYDRAGTISGFKPSKAEKLFLDMLKEASVPIYYEHRLKSIVKEGNKIVELEFENGNKFRAKMFVDATYEGDLLAMAKVSYHVGRESNATYGETINGIQFLKGHNFNYPIDPYKKEGDPSSGLLWGISAEPPGKPGEGDKKIQAYNFRMYLSNKEDRLPFPKPNGYEPERYALLLRYLKAAKDLNEWSFTYKNGPFQLQNGDCNNAGGFSTDNIGRNYEWPEADYATREKIFQDHVTYQQGLMYFMANDPSVPELLQSKVKKYGLAAGEFTETGGWPHQLYIREGRRMISDYVMTEHNCRGKVLAEDSVGMASYTMDSHHCQRVIVDGKVKNEGNVEVGVKQPFPISFRSIVPKESECANLAVPVCLSSTHISYGSIRMEPVFMILGQSAGTAAAMAIDAGSAIQKVEYPKLKEKLLAGKQVLEWTAGEKTK
ncbi:MAG TPA: FAD-dependent oxidoreductase [Planctomycetota bacterium]|nr:FAD-dependent oxidoreductase [Planctomycetota bacterium]